MREAFIRSASLKATRLTIIREGPISDMLKLLITWIEDHTQKRIPLSSMTITTKAKRLLVMVKDSAATYYDVEFTACSGRFKRFKNLSSLHDLKVSGQSSSSDAKEAEEFLETPDMLILEENYLPKQIFNVDETSLSWKQMHESTFIHKEAKSMPGLRLLRTG